MQKLIKLMEQKQMNDFISNMTDEQLINKHHFYELEIRDTRKLGEIVSEKTYTFKRKLESEMKRRGLKYDK